MVRYREHRYGDLKVAISLLKNKVAISPIARSMPAGDQTDGSVAASGAPIYRLSIVSGRYLAVSVNIVSADNPLKNIGTKNFFSTIHLLQH